MEKMSSKEKEGSLREQKNLEWLRTKLKILWSQPQYCGLCLETTGSFFPLTTEFAVNEDYNARPLKEFVSTVMNIDIDDCATSDMICEQCTEKSIQSYLFIENTKKLFKVLNSCVNDIFSKVSDLNDELGENEMYKNANVMIVNEYDTEIMTCVDELAFDNIVLSIPCSQENLERLVDKTELSIESGKKLNNNLQNKENKGPVIIPTQRTLKHPRTKEVLREVTPPTKIKSPIISMEGGKLVIIPLTTNTPSAPEYNTYSCNSCTNIFTSYRTLKEHEKTLHNSTIYQCRFCSKKYNSQQYLDVHYVSNHSKSRCRICKDLFDTNSLHKHLRENHEKQVSICKCCDLVYYSAEKLETHFKSAHYNYGLPVENKSQCVMCLRNFTNVEIKRHKCKFACLECPSMPCVHHSYLMSYREQILSHATKVKCLDCDFLTKRKEQLIAHVNREHLDHHPFTCNDCGTQFYTKLSLKTHIEQFHQDLKCQFCDLEFKNAKILHQHREVCKQIAREYTCDVCVASFHTSKELENHTVVTHSSIVYPCVLCKKEFITESSLRTHHTRIHSGIQHKKRRKFIECTLCDITFNNLKEMIQHEQLHDTNELFPCKVCSKRFSNLKKLYMHKQKHYGYKKTCENCKKQVPTSCFSQHTAVCTKFNVPYNCEVCGKSFNTISTLKAHKQLHENAIPCCYCKKMVKPSLMSSHLRVNHSINTTGKIIYKCQYCDYVTKKRNECENHINKLHLKIKPYICQICNKAFCGKSRLDEHVRTHSVDNNCFCLYCGKKFANKVCLKMHTRRHTGEKPYECNICYERFRSSSIMKVHRLKKHHDKTIQCPLCDSMFHLAVEMRFHVKKAHWKRPEPFDYKQIVTEEYYQLFEDRRLQKLGEVCN